MKVLNSEKVPQEVQGVAGVADNEEKQIRLYESLEEYNSLERGVTNELIEQRIQEHLQEYGNLPEGAEKQKIDEAIQGMYIGMAPGQRYAEKNARNYYREQSLDELYKELYEKRKAAQEAAKENDNGEAYFLVDVDFNARNPEKYLLAATTNEEALKQIYEQEAKGNNSGTHMQAFALDGKEISLQSDKPQMGE